MKIKRLSIRKLFSSIGHFFLLALIFGIPYTQPPLYTENQNTKFLHGLARAGLGYLNEDWLANTIDPLPAFSLLVSLTYRYFHESLFYIYYLIIFGIYIYSILGIVSLIPGCNIKDSPIKYLAYLAVIIPLHSLPVKLFEFDFSRHFHWGVAKQTVLGVGFQPGVFGVLLLLSIYLFLRKNHLFAILLLDLAATVHSTYILSAAVLTLTYMAATIKDEKNFKKAFLLGLISLILILPIYSYTRFTFTPTSPETWQKSLDIIVNYRIPHHSLPKVWLSDGTAYIQTILVVLALYLIRKTQLFILLFIPFITAISLTIAQIVLNSNSLGFLAPWRLSVFLVPISSCLLVAYLISLIFEKYHHPVFKNRKLIVRLSVALITIFVLAGAVRQTVIFLDQPRSVALMNFIKKNKQPKEVYLIPVDSISFRNFRLYTGAPAFVNRKSHPYKDTEVIEWYNRLQLASQFYESPPAVSCQALKNLSSDYGVTHVVLEKSKRDIHCNRMEALYQDQRYGVYKIRDT